MALFDQYQETTTATFQQRVQTAMSKAAINVQTEAKNSLQALDSAAAATTVTVVDGTQFAVNDLVTFGVGLGTAETRKVTAIATNVLTISATTNAHKAGEVVQKVVYNHANRIALAKAALNSPPTYAALFTNAICGNDATLTIQNDSTITDTQIANNISAVWDSIAGTL